MEWGRAADARRRNLPLHPGQVMEMDRFSLVLLCRPSNAPELPEAELDTLQERHVTFMTQMRERGVMVASGPFDDQPDPSWRGMCLYRTNIHETRRLAAEDPAVKAGRLAFDVITWCVPAGLLPRETTLDAFFGHTMRLPRRTQCR